jgi:serine/threonine-protein kinase RsbT
MTSRESEGKKVDIESDEDVVRLRQVVREMSVELGLGIVDQTKTVTAASELGRNTRVYGNGGCAWLTFVRDAGRRGLRIEFVDDGPGIADVDLALQDGYSSGSGMGLGLSGSRRLVDDFDIETGPDCGTRVTIVKWLRT